jgi:UDP-GlcNAc:undecaprenyl-phosphate GlcNAc-1-phosphate transferase
MTSLKATNTSSAIMHQILQHKLALSASIAFVAMLCVVWLVRPTAEKIGLVDIPGGRKQHKLPTPVIGGLCMFIGFCFALLTLEHSLQPYRGFLGASAILIFVGVLDDLKELSAKARFMAQIAAAVLMAVWSHNIIHSFGDLLFFGEINLGYFAIPVTVFAAVGTINAVNMMDGIDGLLGSMSFIQFLFLSYFAWSVSAYTSLTMIVLIMMVLLGYLIFNFPFPGRKQASVFMGDAGSMFIGFVLAWFLIDLSQGFHAAVYPVTMLWVLSMPLFDTTRLLIKRTLKHGNPLEPGRDHLHHLLKAYGYSDLKVCGLVCLFTVLFGLFGTFAHDAGISQSVSFLLFLFVFIVYCVCMRFGWRYLSREKPEALQY